MYGVGQCVNYDMDVPAVERNLMVEEVAQKSRRFILLKIPLFVSGILFQYGSQSVQHGVLLVHPDSSIPSRNGLSIVMNKFTKSNLPV